jgi:hypothetical protein
VLSEFGTTNRCFENRSAKNGLFLQFFEPDLYFTVEDEFEVAAGLKYQPQYNSNLTSPNWTNLGSLLTSPTNAILSAFDAVTREKQRFYRVIIQQ